MRVSQQDARHHVIHKGSDKGPEGDDGEHRPGNGHDNQAIDLHVAAAINVGGIVQLGGDRVDVAFENKGVGGDPTARINKDEESLPGKEGEDGADDGVHRVISRDPGKNRNGLDEQNAHERGLASAETIAGVGIARKGYDQQREQGAGSCNDEGILDPDEKIGLFKEKLKVFQGKVKIASQGDVFALATIEGGDQHLQKRPENGHRPEN